MDLLSLECLEPCWFDMGFDISAQSFGRGNYVKGVEENEIGGRVRVEAGRGVLS